MKLFLSFIIAFIVVSGCDKNQVEQGSPVLAVDHILIYKNMTGKDSILKMTLNYEDTDGDLGLSKEDTFPPFNYLGGFYYNLKVEYFIKENKQWKKILIPGTGDTVNFNQRFPRLNLSERSKPVKGQMELNIPASPYPGIFPDTIKLACTMLDRKLHQSNIAHSKEIILQH